MINPPLHRIVFTSCSRIRYTDCFDSPVPIKPNESDFTQPIWDHILAVHNSRKIDALLLLGDQIYTDFGILHRFGARPKTWKPELFHRVLYEQYKTQYEKVTAFRELLTALHQTNTKIRLTWDDHDFGYDNGSGLNADFKNKLGSAKILFEQYQQSLQATLTDQYPAIPVLPTAKPIKGIEQISPSLDLDQEIEIVMLDSRFYRSEARETWHEDLLGDAQWGELKGKMSGLQQNKLMLVCLGSTYSKSGWLTDQSWAQGYMNSHKHFDEFTKLAKEKHILFLAGDVHHNDFIERDGFCELISSGAHMPFEWLYPIPNQPRFCVIDVYADEVKVEFYKNGRPEAKLSKTINRSTGRVI
jgi:PhoD-like phosphatase